MDDITIGVLGAGGIGRRTLEYATETANVTPVAACDRNGVAIDHDGLDVAELLDATEGNIASGPKADDRPRTDGGTGGGAVADADGAVADADAAPEASGGTTGVKQTGTHEGVAASTQATPTETPIDDIIAESDAIDAVLIALPNLEHDFIPRVADRFADADYEGVLVDVLKRSRVIGLLDERTERFEACGITFVCGAGATPGFLPGAAALAAQSFVEVESVDIWWGVGLKSGYEDNRGTVREDIAHLPGYDIETARELTDEDIEEARTLLRDNENFTLEEA